MTVIAKLEGRNRTVREGLVKPLGKVSVNGSPVGITVVPAPTRPNDSLLWNIRGQWRIDFAEFKEVEVQICEHSIEDIDILRKERQSCALAGSVVC
ncbi:hypothetical protein FA15DRAFT_674589 [Coprinopsis marcescibilis]|uniref:Uncharacterized protein n=1 Tax=Coprinopsis marcescibilis TaxID=230819 RepID=A0A5C3KH22_COPMA|nr:hypothetical protein FA15DRAFT_674589 [Coprinopsis marcescibilis]